MRKPKVALCLFVILSLISLVGVWQLKVDTNILKLLPQDMPETQAIRKLNEEEGGAHFLTLAIKGENSEVRREVIQQLSDKISQMPEVEYVMHDLSVFSSDLKKRMVMFHLPLQDLDGLSANLQKAVSAGPALTMPGVADALLGDTTTKLERVDTTSSDLCLGQLLKQQINSKESFVAAMNKGCGEMSQIIVRPNQMPFFPDFSRPFMEKIYSLLDEAELQAKGLEIVWIGGAYHYASEDIKYITQDIFYTILLSFFLVFLLLSLAYREKRAMVIIFIPLMLGNLWTWGFTSFAFGEVNTFTSFCSAILLGLGVDFAIHLYSRYREERARIDSLEEAVQKAWNSAGPPCGAAALTSAAGFISLYFANFIGFKQLGLQLSVGVLICLCAIVVGLPLLILWRERQDKPIQLSRTPEPSKSNGGYRWASLGLVGILLLSLAFATQLNKIEYEYDISLLRHDGVSYTDLDDAQRARAEESFSPTIMTFESDTALREAHNKFNSMIEQKQEPLFKGVLSVYSLIPQNQQQHLDKLDDLHAFLQQKDLRYLPPSILEYAKFIQETPPRQLLPQDLPKSILQMLGAGTGKHRIMIYANGNQWDIRNNNALAMTIEKNTVDASPKPEVAGEFIARANLFRLMQDDAPTIASIAICLIFVATLLYLRRLGRALISAGILIVGMCWALVGLLVFDIKISIVNFVGFPILMGVGIDVIIHLLHRISEEGPGRIGFAMRTTGVAALLSVSTTMLSFASLLIAKNGGINSLGTLIVIGLFLVSLAAFVMVPLCWMNFYNKRV